ncbi:MAG: DUF1254 domain-containing protein [Planctomycetota bacterium]|nr:DUF1254 domain-containing protein [Planctomycetota bacterium]
MLRLATALLVLLCLVGVAFTEEVDTPAGKLAFENGYPTDDTVAKLYDRIDFQRACQAYLWALPLVEMAEWQYATKATFGASDYDYVAYITFTEKQGILTANATTPYFITFPNLAKTGPLVVVEPSGLTAGGILDMWQRPLVDTGQIGPFKGAGGKYLLLGPDHPEMKVDGHHVIRSPNNNVMLAFRVLDPDPARFKGITDQFRIYPHGKEDSTPKTRLIRPGTRKWTAMQPRGLGYWERLADMLLQEPVHERDRIMMGMLATIGIEKGKPFDPDLRLQKILGEASIVGEAMARANSFAKRIPGARVWEDRRWEMSLLLKEINQEIPGRTQFDERASWFYEAIGVTEGMLGRTVNAGQVYLESQKDSDGNWLDGGKHYRIRVPANAPVKQFWSFTVYDNTTRCLIDTGVSPDRSSRMKLQVNDDGSVDLYFGPTAPKGKESNWVKTLPGKGWFTYFRLYAPTKEFFDRSWVLNDIERVK